MNISFQLTNSHFSRSISNVDATWKSSLIFSTLRSKRTFPILKTFAVYLQMPKSTRRKINNVRKCIYSVWHSHSTSKPLLSGGNMVSYHPPTLHKLGEDGFSVTLLHEYEFELITKNMNNTIPYSSYRVYFKNKFPNPTPPTVGNFSELSTSC